MKKCIVSQMRMITKSKKMKRKVKGMLAAAMIMTAVLTTVGCGKGGETASAKTETLKIAVSSEPDNLNPMLSAPLIQAVS